MNQNLNNFINTYCNNTGSLYQQHQQVVEWNSIAGNGTHDLSDEKFKLQVGFVCEEYQELLDAIAENNVVEIYDALGDLFVVLSYLCYMDSSRENIAIAPVDFTPASTFLFGFANELRLSKEQYRVSLLDQDNINAGYLWHELDLLIGTIANTKKCIECLDEVIRSNLTKYPVVGTVDPEKECEYIENKGRYTGITYKISKIGDVEYYVFFDCNGKIMKPSTMQNPDISKIIY